MITSTSNPTVKRLHALYDRHGRNEHALYPIEGVRLVEEALTQGIVPDTIIVAPDMLRATARGRALDDRLRYTDALSMHRLEVSPPILRYIAETETPSGVVAILPRMPLDNPDALRDASLVIVLDGVADPGNAGTILRTAAAAGADAVISLTGTVDLYAPKVIRAAMGAHLRLPLAAGITSDALPDWLDRLDEVLLADAHAQTSVYDVDLRCPVAIVIGGEARGAEGVRTLPGPRRVAIPMPGGSESLNVAAAAAVILFETVRQRHAG